MILLYHKVSLSCKSIWYVTKDRFYKQMSDLRKMGKVVVPLDKYNPENPNHVCITFDGGYDEMYDVAVPILKKFGYEYDIFVIGNYVGKDNRFDVNQPLENFLSIEHLQDMVARGGAHLQWHTNSHRRLGPKVTMEEWIEELTIPTWIRQLDPTGFKFFAYPYGGNAPWQYDEVRKRFDGALFVRGGSDFDKYRLNRVVIYDATDMKVVFAGRMMKFLRRLRNCVKNHQVLAAIKRRVMFK